MTERERDDLLRDLAAGQKEILGRLNRIEGLLVVTSRSLHDLLLKMESPIVDRIREKLESEFERAGHALSGQT